MFNIPVQGSKAREMIDVGSLVEMLNPKNAALLMPTWLAVKKSREVFANDKAVKRICYVVLRADTDERWLISVGRRGGWKKEWNFGNGR